MMGDRQPPRFVPTLTDVVSEQLLSATDNASSASILLVENSAELMLSHEARNIENTSKALLVDDVYLSDAVSMEQTIQKRVMARLEETLEERLHEALAEVVTKHTKILYLELVHDLERIVSVAVQEAVAQELTLLQDSDAH